MPGFFFGEDEWNERSHIGPRTAVLENPQDFTISSCGLPGFVGEIPGELANQTRDIAQPLAIPAMTGDAECLPVKNRFPFFDILRRRLKWILPSPGFFDLVDRDSRLQHGRIRRQR